MKLLKKLNIREIGETGRRERFALFECPSCGNKIERRMDHGKKQESCGCSRYKTTHGMTNEPLYQVWANMLQRCTNNKNTRFHRYGGRGIKVCKEWMDSSAFMDWALDNGYEDGLTIDRKNNDGNYEPANCRFVPHIVNCQNSSLTKLEKHRVSSIKTVLATNDLSFSDVAFLFNTTRYSVSHIANGRTWKNIRTNNSPKIAQGGQQQGGQAA